jgi:NTE family protein
MIRNLVFKGGGVLGIAYAGVIEVLEEQKILPQVQCVAGTSAGAIIAALISLKYTTAELLRVVQFTDFKAFEDGNIPLQISNKYGLHKGNVFLSWLKQLIIDKGLAENATFADFEKAGMLDLHVFAVDLNSKILKEFSVEKTPNVIVAEAIRASISIPLFFEAWTFSNAVPDDHYYIDGGAISNFPISAFDKNGIINNETLGFYLKTINDNNIPSTLQSNQLELFIKDFFETLTSAQTGAFENNMEEKKRTVVIDDFGISATNFDLSNMQKQRLYNSGKIATANYLAKYKL